MTVLKRICSIFLAVMLVLNSAGLSAVYAESSSVDYEKLQKVLTSLEIMSYNSEGEIDNSKTITRAEFVDTVANIIGVNTSAVASESYFYDVPVDAWYTNALNTLVQLKIIYQSDDMCFYPDRVISTDEAVKMVVCMLGYRVIAEKRGAYPYGYQAVGTELGLFDHMPSGSEFTNAHMTVLLYNAIDANTTKLDGMDENQKISTDGEKLLEHFRKIYKTDGVVQKVYGMASDGMPVNGMNEAVISGVKYSAGEELNISEYFGRRVRIYYHDGDDGELLIKYVEPYYDNDTAEILSDDFDGYNPSANSIAYQLQNKTKTAKLEKNAVVFRNGCLVSTELANAFDIKNGDLKLVDSDGDGEYDVCVIYDYKTVVVNNIDAENKRLTYKDISGAKPGENYNGTLDFIHSGNEYMTVYSPVGTPVDFAAITADSVIDIAESADGKNAVIYINSSIFEGKLESVNSGSGSDAKMVIAGEEYGYYSGFQTVYSVKVGDGGQFKTNRYGKVSYYKPGGTEADANPSVYIIRTIYNSDDEKCLIKYIAADGKIYTRTIAEKLKLDGGRVDGEKFDNVSHLERMAATAQVNADGEVVKIDTAALGINENETNLKRLLEYDGTGAKWCTATRIFGKTVICSPNAVVFVVPPGTDEYSEFRYDEDSYSIGSVSDFVSNQYNAVDCYKYGSDSYCNIVVLYKYKYKNPDRNRFIFVTDVSKGLSADDEVVTKITGYQRGALVSYDITNTYSIGSEPDCDIVVEKGDIITVGAKDKDGIVGNVEVHFDRSRNWSGTNQICAGGYMFDNYANRNYDALNYWLNIYNDLQGYTRFIAGYPVSVDGSILKINYPKVSGGVDSKGYYKWRKWLKADDTESFDELMLMPASVPIIVYDAGTGKFETGSATDIYTSDTYEYPSQIFIDMRWGEVWSIFVINNNTDAWTKNDITE